MDGVMDPAAGGTGPTGDARRCPMVSGGALDDRRRIRMGDGNEEAPFPERMELPDGMTKRCIRSDGWYVGQIEEMPEAISQGHTLQDLVDMIEDAKATLDEKGA